MNDKDIACALVRRMWTDGIVSGSQFADGENIVRQAAIPRSDEGRAKDVLADMASNTQTPVITIGSGVFALRRDRSAVQKFLESVCSDSQDIPWDLR